MIKNNTHFHNVRVYFKDTDAGGIVYHANYLSMAETARAEMLHEIGFANIIMNENGARFGFAVKECKINFIKPAVLDDMLEIRSTIIELKNASMVIEQNFYKNELLINNIVIKLVCLGFGNGKPLPIPKNLREKFSACLIPNQQ